MSYLDDAIDAALDIQEDGTLVTLTRVTGGTKNSATGQTTGATTQTQSVYAVKLPAKSNKTDNQDNMAMTDTSVEVNTSYLLMAARKSDGNALDWYPEFDQAVTINSVVWKISGVGVLVPDGVTPLLFKVAIRR